jgi:hypothetical protein
MRDLSCKPICNHGQIAMIRPVSLPPRALVRVQRGMVVVAKRNCLGVWNAPLAEAVVDAVVNLDGPVSADHARQACYPAHMVKVALGFFSFQPQRARVCDLAQR